MMEIKLACMYIHMHMLCYGGGQECHRVEVEDRPQLCKVCCDSEGHSQGSRDIKCLLLLSHVSSPMFPIFLKYLFRVIKCVECDTKVDSAPCVFTGLSGTWALETFHSQNHSLLWNDSGTSLWKLMLTIPTHENTSSGKKSQIHNLGGNFILPCWRLCHRRAGDIQ